MLQLKKYLKNVGGKVEKYSMLDTEKAKVLKKRSIFPILKEICI
jgi:hypothetical protein